MLREIGQKLDQNIFPFVKNGGIVMPSDTATSSLIMGEDSNHVKQERPNRSKTRTRTRSAKWKREAGGQGKACATAQVISSSLQIKYVQELDEVNAAYPGIKVWQQKEGMWLLCQSALLPDALHNATFLCAIPFDLTKRVRSWGFWNGHVWIGPRHTNLPDGSICAYDPSDGTWSPADPLIKLLDIYTLWAVRHLHLQIYDRWPGAQVAHYAYERLTELKKDELCGCGSLDKRYSECCLPNDLRRNRISDAIEFILLGGARRRPPEAVIRFLKEQDNPPSL